MKRYAVRYDLYAITLLMVMLLQVGIKTFHVHHEHASIRIVCEDCDQHRVHDGHLIDWDGQSDDCMLCQLLTAQYVAAGRVNTSDVTEPLCPRQQDKQRAVCLDQWQNISQRGPPAVLL